MATRQSIEFDFNKAKKQAERLDEIANNLSGLANNKLSASMQTLSQNWQGGGASAYINKGDELKDNMVASANELHNIASDIRTIARNVYNAELQAIEIAEQRTY